MFDDIFMAFGFTKLLVVCLYVDTAEMCKLCHRERVTFFGVATPTQCLIRREWPIVGFCTKLVVGYSGQ